MKRTSQQLALGLEASLMLLVAFGAPSTAVPGVPLSSTTYGDTLSTDRGLSPVTTDAKYLSTSSSGGYAAFVYSPSIGEKVWFASATGLGASSDEIAKKDVFLSACRWVASGN